MVRPSQIARKARRTHQRQQESFQKQNLPICQGCHLCSATKDREDRKAIRNSGPPDTQQEEYKQSLRSKIRQGLKHILFKGTVTISPRRIALTEAANKVGSSTDQSQSVYWTDGSRLKSSCGIGIAYCSSIGTWSELSWGVRRSVETYMLEIYAIAKALEISWKIHCDLEVEQRPTTIRIYSDCVGALEYFARFRQSLAELHRLPHGEELVGPGIIAVEGLSALKVGVELKYVPGHAGIQGNLKADRAARRGAKHAIGKPESGKLMTECISIGHHYV